MKELKILDYNKDIILRVDASKTGLGAVLLQEGEKKQLEPIEWASKKLTPVEKKYPISEKRMLAIVWGISKFDYELKRRAFKIQTDHKALEYIKSKPEFKSNRINRWIEKIEGYDFKI